MVQRRVAGPAAVQVLHVVVAQCLAVQRQLRDITCAEACISSLMCAC